LSLYFFLLFSVYAQLFTPLSSFSRFYFSPSPFLSFLLLSTICFSPLFIYILRFFVCSITFYCHFMFIFSNLIPS
jgi:hypothetical protein